MSTIYSGILTYDISDHFPIFAFVGCDTQPVKKPLVLRYRPLDDNKLKHISTHLDLIDWTYLSNLTINEACESFQTKIHDAIDFFAPMKSITIPAKKVITQPWMTPGLLKSSRTLNRLFKKSIGKPKHDPKHIEFVKYRNMYNTLKRITKRTHYADLFHKYQNDIRNTWKVLKSLVGRNNDKSNISDQFKCTDSVTSDPVIIADSFCKYFSNVGNMFASAIPPPIKHFNTYLPKEKSLSNSIYLSPTDPNEILQTINSLKPKKSTGHDNISCHFIKATKDSISKPISLLINKSLEVGIVPEAFKMAKVIPIYKSKDKESFTNYRPISLLSSLSKILEKIVHKRVYHFLQLHSIFFPSQYGFRPKHSTTNAVCEFISNTLNSLDNNQTTLGVFLDLSKAFDTIDHNILLHKLSHYGIRGIALDWFKSYLSNRKQYVSYKGSSSRSHEITCGVPQGSVLGPLLFIIYTNDLPISLTYSKCVLFADDTTIYYSSDNIDNIYLKINEDLKSVADWFRANKLTLNINKTNYIIFTKSARERNNNKTIQIGSDIIKKVRHMKFLGIIIDEMLDWHCHIGHCKNKISSGLYALNTLKHLLPSRQLKTLYYSLIHPYLNYGILLWGGTNKSYTHKLEVLQNKSIRILNHSNYNESALPIYSKLNILKFENLFKLELCKFMYVISSNEIPTPLTAFYNCNRDIHTHYTRHSNDIHITSRNKYLVSKSYIHKAPKLWCQLPDTIKQAKSLKSATNRAKKYFMKN
jgi:hypothetical protein